VHIYFVIKPTKLDIVLRETRIKTFRKQIVSRAHGIELF